MALPHNITHRLSSPDDYLRYFENLAHDHVAISHTEDTKRFYSRFEDITGQKVTYPLLLCIPNGTALDNTRDALWETVSFQLWFLESLGSGSPDKSRDIINRMKLLADDFIIRIENDTMPGPSNNHIALFFLRDVAGEPLDDPIMGDKLIGWSLTVTLANPFMTEMEQNELAKWRSLT